MAGGISRPEVQGPFFFFFFLSFVTFLFIL